MGDRLDDVIAEVAAKHGVAVGSDDPILILYTLNDRLLRASADAQQALLATLKQELEVSASRWNSDAAAGADRIWQAALTGSTETITALMEQGAATTAASVTSEVEAVLDRMAARLQEARRIAILNLVAACMTLAAAGIVVWNSLPSG